MSQFLDWPLDPQIQRDVITRGVFTPVADLARKSGSCPQTALEEVSHISLG